MDQFVLQLQRGIGRQWERAAIVELALEGVLDIHLLACEEGYLQRRFEGFVCFWAVALGVLGGGPVRVRSRYLPHI